MANEEKKDSCYITSLSGIWIIVSLLWIAGNIYMLATFNTPNCDMLYGFLIADTIVLLINFLCLWYLGILWKFIPCLIKRTWPFYNSMTVPVGLLLIGSTSLIVGITINYCIVFTKYDPDLSPTISSFCNYPLNDVQIYIIVVLIYRFLTWGGSGLYINITTIKNVCRTFLSNMCPNR